MTICLNCGKSFKGHFCNNCGQKAEVERLTFHVLMEEVLHVFTHLEKGFLFTIWNLVVHPGATSLNYLQGKRKKYQKPVSYFLIITSIYVVVHNFIINHYHYHVSEISFAQTALRDHANILLRSHLTLFLIPIIFVSSLAFYYILSRPKFNYIETLTLCIYFGGTYFMMLLISDILLGVVFKVGIISTAVFLWQAILSSLYSLWSSFDFYKRVHIRFLWLRLIGAAIIVSIVGWAMMEYLPAAWIYFTE